MEGQSSLITDLVETPMLPCARRLKFRRSRVGKGKVRGPAFRAVFARDLREKHYLPGKWHGGGLVHRQPLWKVVVSFGRRVAITDSRQEFADGCLSLAGRG